jgi:hypothetical protein
LAAGRLQKDAQAKYLNSPETPLFHKGATLYNLHRARKAAHDKGQLIAVEGYVDVIAMTRAGFAEAVAPLGTALTEEQLALMWRMTGEPILCFDGDKAGIKAAHRAIDVALPHLSPGRTCALPSCPAGRTRTSCCARPGPEAIAEVVNRPRSFVDVLFAREVEREPLDTPERRADLEKRLRDLVGQIKDEVVRKHYREALEERLKALFQASRRTAGGGQGSGGAQGRRRAPWRPVPARAADPEVTGAVSSRLTQTALFRGASAPHPREVALVLAAINQPIIIEREAERSPRWNSSSRSLQALRAVVLDLAGHGEHRSVEEIRESILARGGGEALRQAEAHVTPGEAWVLAESAPDEALDRWRDAAHLHIRERPYLKRCEKSVKKSRDSDEQALDELMGLSSDGKCSSSHTSGRVCPESAGFFCPYLLPAQDGHSDCRGRSGMDKESLSRSRVKPVADAAALVKADFRCGRAAERQELTGSVTMAKQPAKKDEAQAQGGETADSPLLDLSDAAVKRLIKLAKKRGFVTIDEINGLMPSEEVTSEQIEDILAMFNEMGVNVVEKEEADDAEAAEGEDADDEPEAFRNRRRKLPVKAETREPVDRTDDPVRMYLREMGSVELLSREGEIAIAKRIEAGREAMIAGLCESPLTFQAIIIWRDELEDGKVLLRDIIDLEATYAGPDGKQAPKVDPPADDMLDTPKPRAAIPTMTRTARPARPSRKPKISTTNLTAACRCRRWKPISSRACSKRSAALPTTTRSCAASQDRMSRTSSPQSKSLSPAARSANTRSSRKRSSPTSSPCRSTRTASMRWSSSFMTSTSG